jgi:hypothetical protein
MKGTCQMCGCTDLDCSQCIEASGEPCHWVDFNHSICSRCVGSLVKEMNAYVESNPKAEYKISEFKVLENVNPEVIGFLLAEMEHFRFRQNFTGIINLSFDDVWNLKQFIECIPEIDSELEDFQSCSSCDLPDACADFGCAIKAGLKSPNDFW